MNKLFVLCMAAIMSAMCLVSCDKDNDELPGGPDTENPDDTKPVDPYGAMVINGETYEYDRATCFYELKGGKAYCSIFFSNFEVGTKNGLNEVTPGARADQFMIYYESNDTNLESGQIKYGLEAGSDEMAWLSIMAVGGVAVGNSQPLDNGYVYSEGIDLDSDVNHPTFEVIKNGENYKITAKNIGMVHIFGDKVNAESFIYEGPITWKTVDEWELDYIKGNRMPNPYLPFAE